MNVFIRRAVAPDQATIRALVREAGINPLHLHWRNFIVAECACATVRRVVACAQLRPHGDGSAELASLAVSPALQGMGIGRSLVRTLIQTGPPEVYLMCDAKMCGYYRPFGFRRVGAGDLPREMRALFRVGLVMAWLMGKVTRRPAQVLAMQRREER